MSPQDVRIYYTRPEILAEILRMCKDREVIPVFAGGIYGKRPGSIQFKGDLLQFIRQGAVSFHCSVEHWRNPDALSNDLKRQDMDKMRTAWDFVLDIDSDGGIEVAKITARLLIEELQRHGIKNISAKFSGRRGFHIGICAGAIPEIVNLQPIEAQFPALAQKIAHYLKASIKDKLAEAIVSLDTTLEPKITDGKGRDPYAIVEVEDNWSVRHLFRMPYSLNEKVWRVSLPIDPAKIMQFSPDEAEPRKVLPRFKFLDRFEKNEAERLVQRALEYDATAKYGAQTPGTQKKDEDEELRRHINDGYGVIVVEEKRRARTENADSEAHGDHGEFTGADFMLSGLRSQNRARKSNFEGVKIPEEHFPPCIKKMLEGLVDGRKRAIFVLINFLRVTGYGWDEIEKKLAEWNAKNPEAISDSYWKGQLEYAKKQDKKIPPPNCDNAGYYKDIKVCIPDNYCAQIKNPAGYAARKAGYERHDNAKKGGKPRKTKTDSAQA